MSISDWIANNYIEIFGTVTGILYVILEIRQNIWLWPVGIITSGVYIWVFFTGKLYADMSLQGYYLVISVLGWYWWIHKKRGRVGEGARARARGREEESERIPPQSGRSGVGYEEAEKLKVSHLKFGTGMILAIVFAFLYALLWIILDRLTDSPVPVWDSFITSLSIIATWMLARKIYEHWFLWIVVNFAAATLFFTRGLYPTVILYVVYCAMSFVGLMEWKKSLTQNKT
ncbi:MAG: nicotinamide riboside transporter PnuC [Bacteroidales bacterium]|jgi:nicotinamide mononucleotide transporter|nr:nicotinamide riboside transporter PnuC [Bacteroidales bacterium]